MQEAHFLLHTSLREGMGIECDRGQCAGHTGHVYPVAGLTESTIHGRTGLVVRAERPECVAEALADIMNQPAKYQQLRARAWERAKTLHWNRILPRACDWLEARQAERCPDQPRRQSYADSGGAQHPQ
jgi:glycosyltransferase involved in cell wall biosynthesis